MTNPAPATTLPPTDKTIASIPHVVHGANAPSGVAIARHDLEGRGADPGADHRAQIRTAMVLCPVGVIDAVIDRSVGRLEADVPGHAGDDDLPCFPLWLLLVPGWWLGMG